MCLIIASPKGIAPDMAVVRNAILDNPHGWGVVAACNGKLTAKRGFGLDSLTRAIKRLNGPYLIHFRYATHGAVGIANCHPFKVNRDCYMVHNGVLHIPLVDSRYSDSWHFARNYARPYIGTHGYSTLVADAEHFIGRGNKLAFLRRNGELLIANEAAGTWDGGLWYSNDYSFPQVDDDAIDWKYWKHWERAGLPLDASVELGGASGLPVTVGQLESIVSDYEADCEYCAEPAGTLYFHPDTGWYVCRDCAATLLQEDALMAEETEDSYQ